MGITRTGAGSVPAVAARRRLRLVRTRRAVPWAAVIAMWLVFLAGPAVAANFRQSSRQVALIPGNSPVPPKGANGIMPVSSYVSGRPDESFDKFSFTDIPLRQIASTNFSKYDTVALVQVKTPDLSTAAKAALAQFVANGGKLIIHDGDQTSLNDYAWLLPGSYTTHVGESCNACGSTSGTSQITQDTDLISANPADPVYVNLAELGQFTDAIGDANLLVSDDPRWFVAASGTRGTNETGAQLAYASNDGLIIYNGFDTDMIKASPTAQWRCINSPGYLCPPSSHPSVDWLAQMWYAELNKSWSTAASGPSSGLPQSTPVSSIGTPLPPGDAALPPHRACVAKRTLFLRLRKLARHRPQVVAVDVYVNGRHVLRERGRLHNVTLRGLPRHGSFVVKVVATTKRRYHLISKARYVAC